MSAEREALGVRLAGAETLADETRKQLTQRELDLAGLRLRLRDLQLRLVKAALSRKKLARELLAIALRAFVHIAEMVELLGHGIDLVLEHAARAGVPALDTRNEELGKR